MLNDQEKKELETKWLKFIWFFRCPPLKPSPPKLGCVYAFEMGDATVKIGVSEDADRRKSEVQRAKGQDVLRVHHTGLAPFSFMTKLEKHCHEAFAARRVHGEFFKITFEEACAELDQHADEIVDAFNAADLRFLDEVNFYFNEFLPAFNEMKNTVGRDFKEFKARAKALPEPPRKTAALLEPLALTEKLLEVAKLMSPSPERDKVLIYVVNNLCGEKIF